MTKTVLLTLGRLSKALEISRALYSAGCRVIIAEPFARHVCKPSRAVAQSYQVTAPNKDWHAYRADILSIIEREGVDVVLPVSEEALHVAAFADDLPERTRFASAKFADLSSLHDKFEFIQLAQRFGYSVPKAYRSETAEGEAFARQNDFVLKPIHSCSGLGVQLCKAGDALQRYDGPAIIQERIEGRHVSTCSIVDAGRVIGTVCYEGTVFTGTVAVCFQRVDDTPDIEAWVKTFADVTGHDGFLSFDFIIDANGVAQPIECNPRVTSGAHFFETEGLAAALLDPRSAETLPLKPKTRFQQAYSTLTEAYGNILKPRTYFRIMRELFTARDIVWSSRDPIPFILMTPNSWDVLRPAIFEGVSMGEAAMRDIAWFGDRTISGKSADSEAIENTRIHSGVIHAE